MKKEKTILFLLIFIIIILIINYNDSKYKPEKNIQFELDYECKCKQYNNYNITLRKLNDSHYQVLQMNNESKEILKTFIFEKNHTLTCNKHSVLNRGTNQKIISFSLYDKNPFYSNKLTELSRLIKKMYPNWLIRIYHDNTILKSVKCEIECLKDENDNFIDNTDFCNIKELPVSLLNEQTWSVSIHKMMWRWLPIGDSFVDIFISRDTDSFIIQREINSVQSWLNSNKIGHIMRGKIYFFF